MPRLLDGKLVEDDALPIGRPLRRSRAYARLRVRDQAQATAACSNHIDRQLLDMLPASLTSPPLGIAVGGEREPSAVGRPRWPEEAAGFAGIARNAGLPCHIANLLRLEIEDPDVRLVPFAC